MTFYFKTFRRALSSVLLFVFATTIALTFLVLESFSHKAVPWLLFTVEMLSFVRTFWSMTSKAFFKTFQSVAAEGIGLFVLFPFHLVLTLMMATIKVKVGTPPFLHVLLQTFVIVASVIHGAYTIGLIAVAALTVCAFDKNVWARDIDSSPSPFPISILFTFLCDRLLFWRSKADKRNARQVNEESPAEVPCLSPCTCPPKSGLELQRLQLEEPESGEIEGPAEIRPLPAMLVRVPSAAERRASIVVSFVLRGARRG